MCVMRAQEEQHDGHAKQEFLGRCVLCAVIDLLPHVQVVVGPPVELEWHAADVVEHDVGTDHVRDVGQCPRRLLRNTGHDVVEDFEAHDEN